MGRGPGRAVTAVVLACLVALASALVAPTVAHAETPADPAKRPAFGVQFHGTWADYTDATRAQVLNALQANGATTVRIDVSWRTLEPDSPGTFSAYGLAITDKAISMARDRGMRPLVTLWQTPTWATGSDDPRQPPTTAASLSALTDVSERLARRYASQVDGWEVWNEPNSDDFMRGADPAVYAAVLRAAEVGFHRGAPGVPVVFGGTMHVDDEWVARALDAGALGHYDVMAVHPYQGMADEAPETPDDGNGWRLTHLPALLKVMADRGDTSSPVWFTEFGWRAGVNSPGVPNWLRAVTPEVQADYLVRALALTRDQYPRVTRAYWYKDRADSADPKLAGYGLVYPDGTASPALKAASRYTGASAGSVFVPVSPYRAYDSRWGAGSGSVVGPMTAQTPRTVPVADARDSASGAVTRAAMIPPGATAVAYNVTVDSVSGAGWVRVSPGDRVGEGSTTNWTAAGEQRANALVTGLDALRSVRLTSGGDGTSHVILDVVGYYTATSAQPDGALFTPIKPTRVHDSRHASGGPGPLKPDAERVVKVSGPAGLPAGVTAVALNVTAVPASGSGFLTVVPGSAPATGVSAVNWTGNRTPVANGITVGLDTNGAIKLRAGAAATDVVVDVVGYFAPASAEPGGHHFHPSIPSRIHDSRWGGRPQAPGSLVRVAATDGRDEHGTLVARDVVPAGAAAVIFNATVTEPNAPGFLTVVPGDATADSGGSTSTLNWTAGMTVPNGSVSGLDADRRIGLAVAGSSAHVIVDVVGYYE